MGSSTEHSAYGPTANPWALDRVPGGSSGGSAAAVAACHAPLSIGTDTGGSIRQPAALCGIVGMKPTYGRVSRYGIVAFASSLDQIGPFARDARDAAALLHAVAGRDDRDSTSSPEPVPATLTALPADDDEAAASLRGKRLGLPREYFVAGMEPGVEARVREAVAALEAAGATVEEVSLPHTDYGLATYYIVAPAEASANLARYDGIRYGPRLGDGDVLANYLATRGQRFGAEVKRRIMLGTYALSAGYYDAYYLKAQKVRTLIKGDFDALWAQGFDALVAPTSPTVAFRVRRAAGRPGRDVPVGRLHAAGQHGRAARGLDPVRPLGGAPGRAPADRRGMVRGDAVRPGARLRGDHRGRGLARASSRPSSPRPPILPRPHRRAGRVAGRRGGRADATDTTARRHSPSAPSRSASRPCRRRGSAGSSTSRRRWTTSSASGSASPTSTRPGSSSRPASRACARAGRTTPATSARSSCGARWRAISSAATASTTTRRPSSSITVGASEAVDLALRATCDPGDEVILHEPSYVAYVPAIVFAGGVVRHVATRFEDDFALDPAAVEAAITPRTKALFLGYPCNPTGAVLPRRRPGRAGRHRGSPRPARLQRRDLRPARLRHVPAPRDERAARHARADDPDGRLLEGVRDDRLAGRLRRGPGRDPRGDGQGPPVRDHVGADDGPGRRARRARRGRGRRRADARRVRPPPPPHRRRAQRARLETFEPRGAFYAFPRIRSTGLDDDEFAERLLIEERVAVVPGHRVRAVRRRSRADVLRDLVRAARGGPRPDRPVRERLLSRRPAGPATGTFEPCARTAPPHILLGMSDVSPSLPRRLASITGGVLGVAFLIGVGVFVFGLGSRTGLPHRRHHPHRSWRSLRRRPRPPTRSRRRPPSPPGARTSSRARCNDRSDAAADRRTAGIDPGTDGETDTQADAETNIEADPKPTRDPKPEGTPKITKRSGSFGQTLSVQGIEVRVARTAPHEGAISCTSDDPERQGWTEVVSYELSMTWPDAGDAEEPWSRSAPSPGTSSRSTARHRSGAVPTTS